MESTENITARSLALDAMIRIMDRGEYSDKVLHEILEKNSQLSKRDRDFFTRLVQGTTERCLELDYIIDRYAKTPVRKMKPTVREILRLAVYQIMYMDQVPESAACNEAVKLTVARKLMPLKNFVNGILRNVARFREDIPYPSRKGNPVKHFSVWYSMPEWIVEHFLREYGDKETEKILQSFLERENATTVRCNLAQASREQIVSSLEKQGVQVEMGRYFDYALHLSGYGRLTELEAFEKGWIQVQDESSMLVGQLAELKPGSMVIDVCAAPGGKSLHVADRLLQMEDAAKTADRGGEPENGENTLRTGMVWACDVSKEKVALIRQNVIRTGIHNVKLKKQDATILREEWTGKADLVIADLPCSGLGVMGNKSDIKYKTKEQDISSLANQQKKILSVVSQYVKPGGMLLYSTCTIARKENEDNVHWIEENLQFERVSIEENLPEILKNKTGPDGYIQILPQMAGTDGFFVSAFRRFPASEKA